MMKQNNSKSNAWLNSIYQKEQVDFQGLHMIASSISYTSILLHGDISLMEQQSTNNDTPVFDFKIDSNNLCRFPVSHKRFKYYFNLSNYLSRVDSHSADDTSYWHQDFITWDNTARECLSAYISCMKKLNLSTPTFIKLQSIVNLFTAWKSYKYAYEKYCMEINNSGL